VTIASCCGDLCPTLSAATRATTAAGGGETRGGVPIINGESAHQEGFNLKVIRHGDNTVETTLLTPNGVKPLPTWGVLDNFQRFNLYA
jgi:hypothetical protein